MKIDNNIPPPSTQRHAPGPGHKPGTTNTGTSRAHLTGTQIYKELQPGQSALIDEGIKPQHVAIRLKRLDKLTANTRTYVHRKEGDTYRFWRIS